MFEICFLGHNHTQQSTPLTPSSHDVSYSSQHSLHSQTSLEFLKPENSEDNRDSGQLFFFPFVTYSSSFLDVIGGH